MLVLRVSGVKKPIGVILVGTVVLLALFWWLGRKNEQSAQSSTGSAATLTTATAAATPTAAPAAVATPSDADTCARLATLCETSDQKVDVGECNRKLTDARKLSGPGNVDRADQCIADAKTCAAAAGCMSGTVGLGTVGEFLKGVGSALSH